MRVKVKPLTEREGRAGRVCASILSDELPWEGQLNIDSKVEIRLFAVPAHRRRLWGFSKQFLIKKCYREKVVQDFQKRLNNCAEGSEYSSCH